MKIRCAAQLVAAAIAMPACGIPNNVLVVDIDSTASTPDGSDWSLAYPAVQDAIDAAENSSGAITQIWVAEGTYIPTWESISSNARSKTFRLVDDLEIFGGFQGNENVLADRKFGLYPTILSGDLDGDDGAGFQNYDDNVYHVVTAFVDDTARLDGFTIIGGFADGSSTGHHDKGAGVIADGGYFIRCTIKENWATTYGGGAFFRSNGNGDDSANFLNCHFVGNKAAPASGTTDAFGGAAAGNDGTRGGLKNCRFVGNTAQNDGGAVWIGH